MINSSLRSNPECIDLLLIAGVRLRNAARTCAERLPGPGSGAPAQAFCRPHQNIQTYQRGEYNCCITMGGSAGVGCSYGVRKDCVVTSCNRYCFNFFALSSTKDSWSLIWGAQPSCELSLEPVIVGCHEDGHRVTDRHFYI